MDMSQSSVWSWYPTCASIRCCPWNKGTSHSCWQSLNIHRLSEKRAANSEELLKRICGVNNKHVVIVIINKVFEWCIENGVHLLSFPPHCSHRLQPLDCTVYYSLKRHYNAQCDSWCNSHPRRPMQPLDIPAVCATAFKLAMTSGDI